MTKKTYGYFRIGYSGNVETVECPDYIEYVKNKLYTIRTKHGLDIAVYLAPNDMPSSLPVKNKKISELSFYEDIILIEGLSTPEEIEKFKDKNNLARQYLIKTKEKTQEMKIPLEIVSAYIFFNGDKVIFSFISDEKKIDFRNLAKELGQIFKIKIELHKIYNRDFSALLDELGSCGNRFCCSSCKIHKKKGFQSNNDSVVSNSQIGCCGKPKCCLNFEN